MRRTTKATTVALLVLLAWPAMAGATCAWILWMEQPMETGKWHVVRAYENQSACLNTIEIQWSREGPDPARLQRNFQTGRLEPTRYECFPDTVDPREPTGGK